MALPGFRTHRKFKRLIRLLQLPEAYVLGHVQMLWETSYEKAAPEIGDELDVEISAGWVGEPGVLCRALLECGGDGVGLIEPSPSGGYQIHDFYVHAPKYVLERCRRNAERESKGQTLADLRREAGIAGAQSRWNSKRELFAIELIASEQDLPSKNSKCSQENGKLLPVQASPGQTRPEDKNPSDSLESATPPPGPPEVGHVQRVVDAWNERVIGKMPRASTTPGRVKTIKTQMKRPGWFDDFLKACDYIVADPWFHGQNDRSWVATIDYLLRPGKATELAEKSTIKKPKGASNGFQAPAHRSSDRVRSAELAREHEARLAATPLPGIDPLAGFGMGGGAPS